MVPFYAKIMVVGHSTSEINHIGYVSAETHTKYHFDVQMVEDFLKITNKYY